MEKEEVSEDTKVEEKNVEVEAAEQEVNEDEAEKGKVEEIKTIDYKEKYYYLAADVENIKKRQQKERDDWVKYGNTKILESLVEVVDNLDRTLDAIKDDDEEKVKNIRVGIEMVKKQFDQVLTGNGLTVIEALGKTFDPNFHEALTTQESEDIASGDVMQEFQKGYILNGRLLRPAKVIVAK